MNDDGTPEVSMPAFAHGRHQLPDHVKPKFSDGDYVVVIKSNLYPILKGFAGQVHHAFGFDKRIFYHIVAENYGPTMKNIQGGGKNVRAWLKGNIHYAPGSELMLTADAPDDAVYRDPKKI